MADNSSLGAAKTAKNDEFYTQYSDIEAEMNAYVEYNPDVFRDKTILLPCDDPEWSNFTRYFASNFERFGLKKLISTSYAKSSGSQQLTMFESSSPLFDVQKHDTHGKLFTLTRDTDGSGNIDLDDIEFSGYLDGDGDFRSKEVCALRDEADIITMAHNLKFNKKLKKKLLTEYGIETYPHYDNYDAIEVPFTEAIPSDYDGVMGVPTTFMDKYNPDQFDIIGIPTASSNDGSLNLGIDYSKHIGYKQDGTKTGRTGSTFGACPVFERNDNKNIIYTNGIQTVQAGSCERVFIRRKKGVSAE